LVVTDSSNDTVSVFFQEDNGLFADRISFSVGSLPRSVAVGDLNGDGGLDMVVMSSRSDGASILMNLCSTTACPADLNGDGTLNFFDVSIFIAALSAQDPIGDFTGDGRWNFFDVSAFLAAFAKGCP